MAMTEFYKPFIVMHVIQWDFWKSCKSHMTLGKKPHTAIKQDLKSKHT